MEEAARKGFLSVVQILHTNSMKGCDKYAMNRAAKYGHLPVVQWLHANRKEGYPNKAMTGASSKSHLEVVRYLHEVVKADCCDTAWKRAAFGGHLPVVQYLLNQVYAKIPDDQRRPGQQWTRGVLLDAGRRGHLDVVQWLQQVRPERCGNDTAQEDVDGFTQDTMNYGAGGGHLDIIQSCMRTAMEAVRLLRWTRQPRMDIWILSSTCMIIDPNAVPVLRWTWLR